MVGFRRHSLGHLASLLRKTSAAVVILDGELGCPIELARDVNVVSRMTCSKVNIN